MFLKKKTVVTLSAIIAVFCTQTYAIIGIGGHWNLNNTTLQMSEAELYDEAVVYDKFQVDLSPVSDIVIGKDIPFAYTTRMNFKNTGIDFGGKLFIDVIPFINAVELGFNLGVWEYEGALNYLDTSSISKLNAGSDFSSPKSYQYKALPLTLKANDLDFFGLDETPYAKMNFDLTVRKELLALPPVVNLFKLYAGAGVSAHFATPVLSNTLIERVLEDQGVDLTKLLTANSQQELGEAIVKKIIEEFSEPSFGMHVLAGLSFKLPVFPIGLYIDGKYYIPFGEIDPNVEMGGMGFLISTGLSLSL